MKTQRIIPFLAILVATACSTVEEVPQQREALALADATVQHQRSVPDASVASHDDSKLTLPSPDMLLDVVPSSASASRITARSTGDSSTSASPSASGGADAPA